jgi:regulatory protein
MSPREPQSDAERLAQALGWAMAHVNRRERTVSEVRRHLERKGVAEVTVEAVVQELVDVHLVDDERFAEMFIVDKRELQQWGTERIRRGLQERGVARELAGRALAAADARAPDRPGTGGPAPLGSDEPLTELDRALAFLRRRFPDPPRERRDRDRALGALLRKGYESELAFDALAAHARGA